MGPDSDLAEAEQGRLDPTALVLPAAARLLGVDEDVLRSHVAEGAPLAADGTINLVHYAAWLNRRLRDGD